MPQTDITVEYRHEQPKLLPNNRRENRYYRITQGSDLRKQPRTWRTRKDPFGMVWDELRLRLELVPETTAKVLIEYLIIKYPGQFSLGHLITLQRRISAWRLEQRGLAEQLRILMVHKQPEAAFATCYNSDKQQRENIEAVITELA